MFDKDFYPTPSKVIDLMLQDIDLSEAYVLEPHGGSGNILKRLAGAKRRYTCELHPDLAEITKEHCEVFLGYDFLKVKPEDVIAVNLVVMNPPFSNQNKHLEHAYKIVQPGTLIVSLCNFDSIRRDRVAIGKYTLSELGNVFSDSERKTDVNVGLIRTYKPATTNEEFDAIFDADDEEASLFGQYGVMGYDVVRDYVNQYRAMAIGYDKLKMDIDNFNSICAFASYKPVILPDKDKFLEDLQSEAWDGIFGKLNIHQNMTSDVYAKVQKYFTIHKKAPFTVKNVKKVLQVIYGTTEQNMYASIVKMFEDITSRYHENRYQHEGWKTNDEFIVNKKFILPYAGIRIGYDGKIYESYGASTSTMTDLAKAVTLIMGERAVMGQNPATGEVLFGDKCHARDGEKIGNSEFKSISLSFSTFCNLIRGMESGKWYNFTPYMRIKAYKKLTLHVEFIDEDAWAEFNRIAIKDKGFSLASSYTTKRKRK